MHSKQFELTRRLQSRRRWFALYVHSFLTIWNVYCKTCSFIQHIMITYNYLNISLYCKCKLRFVIFFKTMKFDNIDVLDMNAIIIHCSINYCIWLRKAINQAINWTNLDLSSLKSISQGVPQTSITKLSLKIAYLNFYWNLPVTNELINNTAVISFINSTDTYVRIQRTTLSQHMDMLSCVGGP